MQCERLDVVGFYEGQPKRIALLADDFTLVSIIVEEYSKVHNQTNQYPRFFATVPIYDYEEKRVRLIAALPHQTMITTLKSIYDEIPDVRERYDLIVTLTFNQANIDNICVSPQFARKYPFYSMSEKVEIDYDQVKDTIIAWRVMLGERIVA